MGWIGRDRMSLSPPHRCRVPPPPSLYFPWPVTLGVGRHLLERSRRHDLGVLCACGLVAGENRKKKGKQRCGCVFFSFHSLCSTEEGVFTREQKICIILGVNLSVGYVNRFFAMMITF